MNTRELAANKTISLEASRIHGMTTEQKVALAILLIVILAMPFMMYPIFLMRMLCFAMFACAYNLLIGFSGLLAFGHAAFFGMGSYVAAWAAKSAGMTPELAILLGGLAGGGMGIVFGLIAIRRQGVYFAMITLALAQLVYFFANQAPFTGGEDGIQGVPRGQLLGVFDLQSDMRMYWFVAALFLIVFLGIYRLIHSPFGQVLKAIRENEERAVSLGYKVNRYKLIAFTLSSALTGLAGGAKAISLGFATLTDVHFMISGEGILMTLLGGIGTLFGPVIGAFLLIFIEVQLASLGTWFAFIQGAIFVVCVLMIRRGIVGEVAHRFNLKL